MSPDPSIPAQLDEYQLERRVGDRYVIQYRNCASAMGAALLPEHVDAYGVGAAFLRDNGCCRQHQANKQQDDARD